MLCKYCGKICDRVHFEEYCSPQCELAYRTTRPEVSLSKHNRQRYGKHLCRQCGREYVGYFKHQGCCTPSCRKQYLRVSAAERRGSKYRIFTRDEFRCAYCGTEALDSPGTKLVLDHIVPSCEGGLPVAGNLISVCASCNRAKWAHRFSAAREQKLLTEVSQRNALWGIQGDQWVHIGIKRYVAGSASEAKQEEALIRYRQEHVKKPPAKKPAKEYIPFWFK